jgi:hypothetical protein
MSKYSQAEKEMLDRMVVNLHKKVSEVTDNQAKENQDNLPKDHATLDKMVDIHFDEPSRPMNVKKNSTVME